MLESIVSRMILIQSFARGFLMKEYFEEKPSLSRQELLRSV